MSYKEKLIGFNDTGKYELESFFMKRLIHAQQGEKILDYGCGLGRMVWQHRLMGVDCFGYDIMDYTESFNPMYFRSSYHFRFRQIYFMHSFAHVENVGLLFTTTFRDLLEQDGRVVVFTPNKDWLSKLSNDKYTPDPTVVRHFNLAELRDLFQTNGFAVTSSGQFGDINSRGQCERIFLIAQKQNNE